MDESCHQGVEESERRQTDADAIHDQGPGEVRHNIPGAALPLLPAASCPACLTAYAGVLSAVGLGFLLSDQVLKPLIIIFLLIGIAGAGFSMLSHRRPGPLVFTLIGSAAVALGRLFWSAPPLPYAGVALLIGASLWELLVKRPRPEALMQMRPTREGGITSCKG